MITTIYRIKIAIIIILCGFGIDLYSQTLKGTVKDQKGESIIGANVIIKNSNKGTITDIDGNYVLEGINIGDNIEVSYIGYVTEKKKYSGEKNIDFILRDDTELIDEVVVVGYGTARKSSLTGSVSSVSVDELPSAGTASVGSMLRGRAAGLNITQNNASPGASLNMMIRGGLSGAKPLIVVDGVPMVSNPSSGSGTIYGGSSKDGDLINLNPNDIESIDILKDASSAAIYGSNASGGVILITTKKGKTGKPEINYSGSVAFQYISDKPEFLNAKDFMIEQNKVFDELGRGSEKKHSQEKIDSFVGNGTDWLDEITRMGIVNEHNLSISSGSEYTKTLFSLSYMDHKGIVKNNSMNRLTGRLNMEQKISNKLDVGVNSSFSHLKYNDVPLGEAQNENSALITSAMFYNPTIPVYDEKGEFVLNPDKETMPNPVSLLDITDNTTQNNFSVNGYLNYKPIKDLFIKATVGVDIKDTQGNQYIPTTTLYGFSKGGQASKKNAKNNQQLVNLVANYTKTFKEKHDLSAMIGGEYKKSQWEGMGIVASQFPYDGALYNNMANSAEEKPDISSYYGSSEMASFFSRINYSLMSKYILNVNLRIDGSSNFSPEHQWGVFPGTSVAWRISEEEWMKNIDFVSNLKLRAGFGQTGNAGSLTGIYSYYKVMNNAFAPDGELVNGVHKVKFGNPDLKWETLTDYSVGLDFGFFNNRLHGSIDLYQRYRTDVIMSKSLMSYQEITSIDYNSDVVYRSRGIDVELHSVNFDNKRFSWFTDVNFSFYKNHTIERDPDFIPEIYQSYVEEWGNIYGYLTNGLVKPGETYVHLPSSTAGAIVYQDINGYVLDENGEKLRDKNNRYLSSGKSDGVLDAADKVILANNTPIPFSINNTFRIGNWDANIYLYGSLNGWKINDLKLNSVFGVQGLTTGKNALVDIKDRWSPSNPNGTLPGVAETVASINPVNSDFFLEKAWYLRLDNISIGYTIPKRILKNKINNIRVYGAVRNIAVFTPYKGMDPETGDGLGAYPNQSSVAIGLEVKF